MLSKPWTKFSSTFWIHHTLTRHNTTFTKVFPLLYLNKYTNVYSTTCCRNTTSTHSDSNVVSTTLR